MEAKLRKMEEINRLELDNEIQQNKLELDNKIQQNKLELDNKIQQNKLDLDNKIRKMEFEQTKKKLMLEAEIEAVEAEENALSEISYGGVNARASKVNSHLGNSVLIKSENSFRQYKRTTESGRSEKQSIKLKQAPFSRSVLSMSQNRSPAREKDTDLMEALVSCNLKALMPHQKIQTFDGDYTKFFLFIQSFDNVINRTLTSDSERLQYLEQYTSGRPNQIVRACLHLPPSEGYKRARDSLDLRYGNPNRVVHSLVENYQERRRREPR